MFSLLIVETDEAQKEVYRLGLDNDFNIEFVDSDEKAAACVQKKTFDVVIAEWRLVGNKSKNFIQTITGNERLGTPIVIIISDDDSESSMKAAYLQGAAYYFTKPYNIIQVAETLELITRQVAQIKSLEHKNQSVTQTTKTALEQASIYGLGMEITASVSKSFSTESIAKATLKPLEQSGIFAAICFEQNGELTTYDTSLAECSETMVNTFKILREQGRIYQFGNRIMLNDEHVSLLVKYVKDNDQTLYESILDMGAKLVPALNTQYKSILQSSLLYSLNEQIKENFHQLHETVGAIGQSKKQVVDKVTCEIRQSFHLLDMSEEQEQYFIDLLSREFNADKTADELIQIDQTMNDISTQLDNDLQSFIQQQLPDEEEEDEFVELEFF